MSYQGLAYFTPFCLPLLPFSLLSLKQILTNLETWEVDGRKLNQVDRFSAEFPVYVLASDMQMLVISQPFLEAVDVSGFSLDEGKALGYNRIKRSENYGEQKQTNTLKYCFTPQIQW